MRKTLYLKFVLAYFIFGVFSFIVVSVFVPSMTTEQLVREKAEDLYSEAVLIADTYATELYNSETDLETVKRQLDALALYMKAIIRIVNPSGRLVLDTDAPINVEEVVIIKDFDPTVTSGSYYVTDNFFDSFDSEVLSVLAPITSNYMVKGYVVVHYNMSNIQASCNSLLSVS